MRADRTAGPDFGMKAQVPDKDVIIEWREHASHRYRDPLPLIPWATLDPNRPWLPERLVSLHGLSEYAALSAAQRLRLSQVEFVASAELGLWLESLFLSRFTRDALRSLDANPETYRAQLQELREEAGHSLMFLELMRRSGIPRLTPVRERPRLAALFARTIPVRSPLFWAAVFVGEAVPNAFNRILLADRTLPEAVRSIAALHTGDEDRHVAYAYERLAGGLAHTSRIMRAAYVPVLSLLIRQFVATCFYPPASVYAAAGIPDGPRMAHAARASGARAALVDECLTPVRERLRQHLPIL